MPEAPESPEFIGSRLLIVVQWTALVAAIVTFLAGVIVGAVLGVLIYTVARGLFAHPHGGALAFFVSAGVLGVASVAMLAAPDLVLGGAGNAAARAARSSLSDAQFAGLALLAAAALTAAAGGLTAVELARARRRDAAGSAERRPAG